LKSNYVGTAYLSDLECLVCLYRWQTKLSNIFRGRGCPNCAGVVKLTNNIIDQRLIKYNKNILRIGNCIDSKTTIFWQCLNNNCKYIWLSSPNNILNLNTGCPNCAGNVKFTNEIIDQKLLFTKRPIKRIGDYISNKIPMPCQCLDCNHIWSPKPNHLLSLEQGCPVCNRKPGCRNEKFIINILTNNNIYFKYDYDIRKINVNEKRYCRLDFYLPLYNAAIEYNGIQHYKPCKFGSKNMTDEEANKKLIRQQERDEYINKFSKSNNINLYWIDCRIINTSLKLREYIQDIITELNYTL
jgi:hypothetical protein